MLFHYSNVPIEFCFLTNLIIVVGMVYIVMLAGIPHVENNFLSKEFMMFYTIPIVYSVRGSYIATVVPRILNPSQPVTLFEKIYHGFLYDFTFFVSNQP